MLHRLACVALVVLWALACAKEVSLRDGAGAALQHGLQAATDAQGAVSLHTVSNDRHQALPTLHETEKPMRVDPVALVLRALVC